MADLFRVDLAGGGRAQAVRVQPEDDLDEALDALGIPHGLVVLLIGGAGKLGSADRPRLGRFFATSFLPALDGIGAILLDGGTDAGVMHMVGAARKRVPGSIRIVGVAPFDKVSVPGSGGSTKLAPGHTDFVLVPGTEWGAEASWFLRIADRLTSGRPTTVLVNGGPIALDEMELCIDRGGRVIVVAGTGRSADEVAAAFRRPSVETSRLSRLATSQSIVIVDISIGAADLANELSTHAQGEPAP